MRTFNVRADRPLRVWEGEHVRTLHRGLNQIRGDAFEAIRTDPRNADKLANLSLAGGGDVVADEAIARRLRCADLEREIEQRAEIIRARQLVEARADELERLARDARARADRLEADLQKARNYDAARLDAEHRDLAARMDARIRTSAPVPSGMGR